MLVSAAVCPHPPAIVPAVSQGASDQFAEVRSAALAAIRALRSADPDLLVCVGSGPRTTRWGPATTGSLRAFGVDARFGTGDALLPLALTVGAYLLHEAGVSVDSFHSIAYDALPDACDELGRQLAEMAPRVALLVMGDASAKRTRQSPGDYDPRAEDFDATAVRALSAPDASALLRMDPLLAKDLWVAGRPAWQVLAGALAETSGPWTGHVQYDAAPLGVGYVVVQLTA